VSILSKIQRINELVTRLYNYYIPPFKIALATLTEDELQNTLNNLFNKTKPYSWFRLDGKYYTTTLDLFKKVVEWDWTDSRKYISESFDCDKFSIYFKSRMAIDYGINTIGVILDYSGGHAYNLVIVKNPNPQLYLFEPQTDEIFTYDNRNIRVYPMKANGWVLIL